MNEQRNKVMDVYDSEAMDEISNWWPFSDFYKITTIGIGIFQFHK